MCDSLVFLHFYSYKVLDRSDKIEDTEYVKWDLTLSLLGAWVLCFVCISKGIKSSGKVVSCSLMGMKQAYRNTEASYSHQKPL